MPTLTNSPLTSTRLVIFDWAGTIVDFGCQAPIRVLLRLFAERGMTVADEVARRSMGMAKRDHIAAILAEPTVQQAWQERFGSQPSEADLDKLYAEFLPAQQSILREHADPIPGAIELFEELRKRGISIGTTTGYTRELMNVLQPAAAAQGIVPDFIITSDEVPQGRPAPDMILRIMELAGVSDPDQVVKVDDTIVGILAARRAGCHGVAVTASGNSVGLTREAYTALSPAERLQKTEPLEAEFRDAGAVAILETVADLPSLLWPTGE